MARYTPRLVEILYCSLQLLVAYALLPIPHVANLHCGARPNRIRKVNAQRLGSFLPLSEFALREYLEGQLAGHKTLLS